MLGSKQELTQTIRFGNALARSRPEVRRRHTPQFMPDAQMRIIEALAEARNASEFVRRIPEALKVVRDYREKLLAGEVSVWDLIVTKHLSKDIKSYRQRVSQVIAAEQLIKEGAEVSAGKNVRFLFTSAENKRYERRVTAEELVEKNTNSDIKKYLLLLYSAAANLLNPFGHSVERVYDAVRGHSRTDLRNFD